MKKRMTRLMTLLTVCICTGVSLSAQSSNMQILNQVNNPNLYKTIDLAHMDRNLSTFTNLVVLSGLSTSMHMTDAHTLFIPTNDAFRDMTIERFAELTNPKNKPELIAFVKRHYLPSTVLSNEFKDSQVISTGNNEEITVAADNYGNVFIGGAKIIKPDIKALNGTVHIVNDFITLKW